MVSRPGVAEGVWWGGVWVGLPCPSSAGVPHAGCPSDVVWTPGSPGSVCLPLQEVLLGLLRRHPVSFNLPIPYCFGHVFLKSVGNLTLTGWAERWQRSAPGRWSPGAQPCPLPSRGSRLLGERLPEPFCSWSFQTGPRPTPAQPGAANTTSSPRRRGARGTRLPARGCHEDVLGLFPILNRRSLTERR